MAEDPKLKDCPFCGSSVKFCKDEYYCDGCHRVSCPNCGWFDFDPEEDEDFEIMKAQVAEKWNSRV